MDHSRKMSSFRDMAAFMFPLEYVHEIVHEIFRT